MCPISAEMAAKILDRTRTEVERIVGELEAITKHQRCCVGYALATMGYVYDKDQADEMLRERGLK